MPEPNYNSSHINDVSGLVAFVTGGGTGIGLMLAQALETNGAKVYISGRRQEKLQEAAKLAKHGNIIPIQGDVNSRQDLQRAVDVVTSETGYIDLLVCNAGQTTFDDSPHARAPPNGDAPVAEIRDYFFNHRPAAVWSQALDTNVASVFSTSMAFLELLDEGNKRREKSKPTSQIVAIGSVGGMNRWTQSFIYNASKAGVERLMKNLGAYLVPHDIRTNIIAPAWFPSDMSAPVGRQWEKTGGVMPRELVPAQRFGLEEEMAGTILYLASRAGGYMNGGVMCIDGGMLHNHGGL